MDFAQFIGQGWNDHVGQPEAVAQRLGEGLDLLRDPGDGAKLAGLAVHVLGEHLGRWQEGLDYFARLASHAACQDAEDLRAVHRSRGALLLCQGDDAGFVEALAAARDPSLPEASTRVRVLAVAASALVGQGQVERAEKVFDEALALAAYGPSKEDPAARALAVTGNNLSWELEEKSGRTPHEDSMLVRAAEIARTFWEIAGGWLQVERAEHRLARSHAAVGHGKEAVLHAERCLAVCEDNEAEPFEYFFAHEALARAHHVAGNGAKAKAEREEAAKRLATLSDDLTSYAQEGLDALDKFLS